MEDEKRDRSPGIDFEKAEFTEGPAEPGECTACQQPLVGNYYQVNGAPVCEACQLQIRHAPSAGSGSGRFLRAPVFGLGAAAAGSAIWYAVRVITDYEVGLIAVLVGLMVGGAVRAGSRRRGGPLYQLLAVGLTYFGICAQYVPDIVQGLREQMKSPPAATATASGLASSPPVTAGSASAAESSPSPEPPPSLAGMVLAVALLLALALAAPFLGGFQNIIGILIIGFALWEAWKMNQRVPLEIEGPFRLGAAPGPR